MRAIDWIRLVDTVLRCGLAFRKAVLRIENGLVRLIPTCLRLVER